MSSKYFLKKRTIAERIRRLPKFWVSMWAWYSTETPLRDKISHLWTSTLIIFK